MKKIDFVYSFHYLCIVYSLLIFSFSCSKEHKDVDRYLDISNPPLVDVSDVVSIDKFIPLRKNDEPLLVVLEDINKVGDKFICSDRNRTIYIFDDEGNLISSSEAVIGAGPGEYNLMLAYGYNKYSNTVEVITPQKMKIYDLDFNFIEDRDIPSYMPTQDKDGMFFSEIYDLDKDIHALVPSSTGNGSIIIYDSSKKEILNTVDFGSDLVGLFSMQTHSFTDLGDSIIFYPPAISGYVYTLDKDNYTLTRQIKIEGFEFEPNNKPNDNYSEYALRATELMPMRLLATDKKIGLLAKEGNSLSGISYLFSNENGNMEKFMIKDGEDEVFPILTVSDGRSIYGLCDGENMNGISSSMKLELPDSLKEYPNVIVCYSLK